MNRRVKSAALMAVSAIAAYAAYDIVWLNTLSPVTKGITPDNINNITYSLDHTSVLVNLNGGNAIEVPSDQDLSLQFGTTDGVVTIALGEKTKVVNPLAADGVEVSVDGGRVTLTANTGSKVKVNVTGSTADGQLKFYGDDEIALTLDNASIANSDGSAINFQTTVGPTITIKGQCSASDGGSYSLTPEGEKENGTVYSLKKLTIKGDADGCLTVSAVNKHAVASSKKVVFSSGNVKVLSAASDGLHGDGIEFKGGTFESVSTTGDAVDADKGVFTMTGGTIKATVSSADTKGVKADDAITIAGGLIDLTLSGDMTKGIKSKAGITIDGGELRATMTGNAVVTDGDPSYCAFIKSDVDFTLNDGNIYVRSSGKGGKGISVDGAAYFNGGTIDIACTGNGEVYTNTLNANDTYSSTCITVDGTAEFNGGSFILANSGSAGKCIKVDGALTFGSSETDGPTINATATGVRIKESAGSSGGGWGRPGGGFNDGDYSNPKAIKGAADVTVNSGKFTLRTSQNGGEGLESKTTLTINGGDLDIQTYDDAMNAATHIQINGGTIHCMASNNDGIDSNGTITITGGVVIACGAASPEDGFDCDNNRFAITGGVLVGVAGATSTPTESACTQRSVIFSASVSKDQLMTIIAPDGSQIVSFKMPKSISSPKFLVSSPKITTGTHIIYTGGTVTGGNQFYEVTTDANYTPGTQSTTFSPSSMVTNISSGGSRPR